MQKKRRHTIVLREGSVLLLKNPLSKAYNAYCKRKGVKKSDKISKDELEPLVYLIGKSIAEHVEKKDGGVHIKQLGYFCNMINEIPEYRWSKAKGDYVRNMFVGGKIAVRTHFTPTGIDRELGFWTMTSTVNRGLKKRIKRNFKRGKVYRAYPFTMRKLLRLSQADVWQPFVYKGKKEGDNE